MKRSLKDILPVSTSHDVGLKRVLLASDESRCSLTQVAVTLLRQGETAVTHTHPDMQECFYVLEGELDVVLDGEVQHCMAEDFVLVDACTSHELIALTDVKVLTIGCVIEAARNKLYPMLFDPNLREVVWGGRRIMDWKEIGEEVHRNKAIGESWEVSAVESAPSVIANGTWAGYELPSVVSKMPEAILGKAVARKYGNRLPLLVKFIDARDDLSIQVHPNDEMAQRLHGQMGKSEMWYVLDAEPGACIYSGFSREVDAEEYARRVADGSITEVLARHEVKAGDVFYIPSGRIHAIGRGVLLAEVQQSSDLTYRIYDYNRPGIDGKPRELHTALAAEALDYTVHEDYRSEYIDEMDSANLCVDTCFFSARVVETDRTFHRNMIKYDSFVISMCTRGDCILRIRSTGDEVLLREGYSCLIPAAMADYDIIPQHGTTRLLEAFIDNRSKSIFNQLTKGVMMLRHK